MTSILAAPIPCLSLVPLQHATGQPIRTLTPTDVTISDVDTVFSISSDDTEVEQGEELTLNFEATDVAADPIVRWVVNWDDGDFETIFGDPTEATHDYADPGTYDITATVFTDDGSPGTTEPVTVEVTVTGETAGTTLDEDTDTLFINGSLTGTGNDTATITLSGGNIIVNASMNGTNPFVAPLSSVE